MDLISSAVIACAGRNCPSTAGWPPVLQPIVIGPDFYKNFTTCRAHHTLTGSQTLKSEPQREVTAVFVFILVAE